MATAASAPITPADIQAIIASTREGDVALKTEMDQATTDARDALANKATAEKDVTAASVESLRGKGARETALDTQKQNIVTQLQASDTSKLMADLSVSIMDAGKEMRSLREQEIKLRSVGLTDNPLQWFMNQFELDTVAGKYNAVAGKNKEAFTQMQQLTLSADQRVELAKKAAATTSLSEQDAAIKKEMASGASKLAEIQLAAAQVGLSTISIRSALNQHELKYAKDQFDVETTMQKLALERSSAARAERSLQLQEETHKWNREAKQEVVEGKTNLIKRVNQVLTTLGGKPLGSFQDWNELSPKRQEDLMKLSMNQDFVEGRLGSNTVFAVETARNMGLPITEAMKPVAQYADRLKDLAVNKMTGINLAQKELEWGKLKKDEQENILRITQKDIQKEYQSNMKPGDMSNPYTPGLALSVVDIKALADNPVIQAYSVVAAANPQASFSGKQLFESARALVLAGKLAPEDAARSLSGAVKLINQDVAESKVFKAAAILPMNTFYTEVPQTAGILGGSEKLVVKNIADYAVALNALVRSDPRIATSVNRRNQYNANENRASVLLGTPVRNKNQVPLPPTGRTTE